MQFASEIIVNYMTLDKTANKFIPEEITLKIFMVSILHQNSFNHHHVQQGRQGIKAPQTDEVPYCLCELSFMCRLKNISCCNIWQIVTVRLIYY